MRQSTIFDMKHFVCFNSQQFFIQVWVKLLISGYCIIQYYAVMKIIIFHNAYCTQQNKCSMRTDNTTVYTFSEDAYSNLSFRFKLIIVIDMCTCVE